MEQQWTTTDEILALLTGSPVKEELPTKEVKATTMEQQTTTADEIAELAAAISAGLHPTAKKKLAAIKPVPIHDSTKTISVAEFGGKANSLRRLAEAGFPTLAAWAIPARYTFNRHPLYLGNLDPSAKYAVRSSGAVSMPGAMETVLGVDYLALQTAVNKVQDSYFLPKAVAYRKANGIPEDMGTGVVIQRYLKPGISGVTFTNDPNETKLVDRFNPITEWVAGKGDQLVGGTVKPNTGKPPIKHRNTFQENLKRIHELWGPSDVEWVTDATGTYLYFVQVRPLKFANPAQLDLTFGKPVDGKALAAGEPIGPPVSAIGKLAWPYNFKAGDVLYAEEFTPETYPLLLQSRGIICHVGGRLCHAAIVARTLGIPAVSAIGMHRLSEYNGRIIGITGDGRIYLPKAGADTPLTPIQTPPVAALDQTRKPRKLWVARAFDANLLMGRFYLAYDRWVNKKITDQQMEHVALQISDVMAAYFYWATACEARHAAGSGALNHPGTDSRKAMVALREKGVRIGTYEVPSRNKFMVKHVDVPNTLARAIEVQELLSKLFHDGEWSSNYGGDKWGAICDMLLAYLKGNMSRIAFCDACFNLQHNGGSAFGKFYWMKGSAEILQILLGTRREGTAEDLRNSLKAYYGPAKLALLNAPSIFSHATVAHGLTAEQLGEEKEEEESDGDDSGDSDDSEEGEGEGEEEEEEEEEEKESGDVVEIPAYEATQEKGQRNGTKEA